MRRLSDSRGRCGVPVGACAGPSPKVHVAEVAQRVAVLGTEELLTNWYREPLVFSSVGCRSLGMAEETGASASLFASVAWVGRRWGVGIGGHRWIVVHVCSKVFVTARA